MTSSNSNPSDSGATLSESGVWVGVGVGELRLDMAGFGGTGSSVGRSVHPAASSPTIKMLVSRKEKASVASNRNASPHAPPATSNRRGPGG